MQDSFLFVSKQDFYITGFHITGFLYFTGFHTLLDSVMVLVCAHSTGQVLEVHIAIPYTVAVTVFHWYLCTFSALPMLSQAAPVRHTEVYCIGPHDK